MSKDKLIDSFEDYWKIEGTLNVLIKNSKLEAIHKTLEDIDREKSIRWAQIKPLFDKIHLIEAKQNLLKKEAAYNELEMLVNKKEHTIKRLDKLHRANKTLRDKIRMLEKHNAELVQRKENLLCNRQKMFFALEKNIESTTKEYEKSFNMHLEPVLVEIGILSHQQKLTRDDKTKRMCEELEQKKKALEILKNTIWEKRLKHLDGKLHELKGRRSLLLKEASIFNQWNNYERKIEKIQTCINRLESQSSRYYNKHILPMQLQLDKIDQKKKAFVKGKIFMRWKKDWSALEKRKKNIELKIKNYMKKYIELLDKKHGTYLMKKELILKKSGNLNKYENLIAKKTQLLTKIELSKID